MNKSETIGQIGLALSKLQGEVQNTAKDKMGYGYRYTTLDAILDMARPLLNKHELSITQLTVNDASNPAVVGVEGVLIHSSGEWLSSTVYMPVEPKKGLSLAQCSGVIISYIRRYQIAALLGIAQTDNDASIKDEPKVETKEPTLYETVVAQCVAKEVSREEGQAWRQKFGIAKLADASDAQLNEVLAILAEK